MNDYGQTGRTTRQIIDSLAVCVRKKSEEKRIQRVECKRCGVVYKPRVQQNMLATGWVMDTGIDMQCSPMKDDGALLIASANPQDYCPRCEERLLKVRERLLTALKHPKAMDAMGVDDKAREEAEKENK